MIQITTNIVNTIWLRDLVTHLPMENTSSDSSESNILSSSSISLSSKSSFGIFISPLVYYLNVSLISCACVSSSVRPNTLSVTTPS